MDLHKLVYLPFCKDFFFNNIICFHLVPQDVLNSRSNQSNVYRWVEAYRTHGHRVANVNPVAITKIQR